MKIPFFTRKKAEKTATADLPRAPGVCQICGVANSMVWIPKHRNGNRGRLCCTCDNTDYGDVRLPPSYNMDDEDFEGRKSS